MNEDRTLAEVETPFLPHRVITHRADGRGATYHNIKLQRICDCIYRSERGQGCDDGYCCIYACYPEVPVGLKLFETSTYELVGMLMDRIDRGMNGSLEDYLTKVQLAIKNQVYFTQLDLEFIKNVRPEWVPAMEESKKIFLEKQERMEQESAKKREEAEQVQTQKLNEQTEQKINEAISVLQQGGVLENTLLKFYDNPYFCHQYYMVNYLMRKYGIKMPLRTQGWVNSKLEKVWIKDGSCIRVQFRTSKGHVSNVFFDYMKELIKRARTENQEVS